MNPTAIDQAFETLLFTPGTYKAMKITHAHQRTLRNHYRRGLTITLHKKLRLLQQAGWRSDGLLYKHEDLVALARFILNSSDAAKTLGPEYQVEKWLARK